MGEVFHFERRVEFADTDMAGIAHFSNYYRYMESAEHGLFRSVGLNIHTEDAQGNLVGWPRVEAQAKFLRPLKFEEVVEIETSITEMRSKALVFTHRLFKDKKGRRVEVAHGMITTVCVRLIQATGAMEAMEIPAETRNLLERYLIPDASGSIPA